jgi:transcription factor C subunit 6
VKGSVLAKRKRRAVESSQDAVEDTPSYSLPSSDHRYRPSPTFLTPNTIERLLEPPNPLSGSVTTPTENGSVSTRIVEQVTRAWAKSNGIGPSWQLFEDRGWFKESHSNPERFISRPLVHINRPRTTEWEPLELK